MYTLLNNLTYVIYTLYIVYSKNRVIFQFVVPCQFWIKEGYALVSFSVGLFTRF